MTPGNVVTTCQQTKNCGTFLALQYSYMYERSSTFMFMRWEKAMELTLNNGLSHLLLLCSQCNNTDHYKPSENHCLCNKHRIKYISLFVCTNFKQAQKQPVSNQLISDGQSFDIVTLYSINITKMSKKFGGGGIFGGQVCKRRDL